MSTPTSETPRTDAEMKDGLTYIAESPPMEHGGFHPNAVATAKAALQGIERLERENAQLKLVLDQLRARHAVVIAISDDLLSEVRELREDKARLDDDARTLTFAIDPARKASP